jgi:hypothetical protein
MAPAIRKFALTVHVTTSVGWLGAVVSFLALAIAGLTSHSVQTPRAAYLAMDMITWFAIVPFCTASLVSGIVESVGTPWGLFKHYWVLFKLLLTVVATGILLLHTQPISYIADVAARTTLSGAHLVQLRIQLAADAGAAVIVLLVTTALAVYKPRGVTPWSARTVTGSVNDAGASELG